MSKVKLTGVVYDQKYYIDLEKSYREYKDDRSKWSLKPVSDLRNKYPFYDILFTFCFVNEYDEGLEELQSKISQVDFAHNAGKVFGDLLLRIDLEIFVFGDFLEHYLHDPTQYYNKPDLIYDVSIGWTFSDLRRIKLSRVWFEKVYYDLFHDRPEFEPELLKYIDSQTGELKEGVFDEK